MKFNQSILVCAVALLAVVSCKKSDPITPDVPVVVISGPYILNAGGFNQNNASLSYYDEETAKVTYQSFLAANGKQLGDTGQDMIVYGDKMYIAMYNSGVIFVTDKQGLILKELAFDVYKDPRCLTAYNGKVYASYFDGGIVAIDTASYVTQFAPIGINPEELNVANGKIYVSISKGLADIGTTVEVIDPTTLTKLKEITVGLNPHEVEVDNNGVVYVTSRGKSWVTPAIPAVFQRINSVTDEVTVITLPEGYGDISQIAMGADDKLYITAGVSNASTDWKLVGKIYTYNTLTHAFEGEFVTDGTMIADMFSLSTDMETGDVYVGTSDYTNTGDVYAFSKDGKLKYKIPVGLSPKKVIFVRVN